MCGHEREIPEPVFLEPAGTEEIEWDQTLIACEEGTAKTKTAAGRFRFVFRFATDEPGCRMATDPFECWRNYRNKSWQHTFSNEFSIVDQ